jgi:hypothetical protein
MLIRDLPILCIHHAAFALYKISFTHYNFMLQLHKYRTYVLSHKLCVIVVVWLTRYVYPINTQTFIIIRQHQKRRGMSVCPAQRPI